MFRYILVGLAGIVLGAYLNYRVNKVTNDQLLSALKLELAKYVAELQGKRISQEGEIRMKALEEAIRILENK